MAYSLRNQLSSTFVKIGRNLCFSPFPCHAPASVRLWTAKHGCAGPSSVLLKTCSLCFAPSRCNPRHVAMKCITLCLPGYLLLCGCAGKGTYTQSWHASDGGVVCEACEKRKRSRDRSSRMSFLPSSVKNRTVKPQAAKVSSLYFFPHLVGFVLSCLFRRRIRVSIEDRNLLLWF